jgi:hypothetical protein
LPDPWQASVKKDGAPGPTVSNSYTSLLSLRLSRRPKRHRPMMGSVSPTLGLIVEPCPSLCRGRPKERCNTLVSRSHPHQGGFGHHRIKFSPPSPSCQGEATQGSRAPVEILTYGYVKAWVQWFSIQEDPWSIPQHHRGLCPSGTLVHTL